LRVNDAGLLPLLIDAVGVGQMLRPTAVSKLRKRFGAHADSGVMVAAIALQFRGVGQTLGPSFRYPCTAFINDK
jgi:hypothetical protein